ncbi:MAG: MoaD/ThiS family protein [Spirochaetales bacterium]|nr:MoaD/ThiS family protein [Spirochaetales bacterium]
MQLGLRFYGALKDHLGEVKHIELADGSCVEDLRSMLVLEKPAAAPVLQVSAFAVDDRLAPATTRLKHGDRVDVLPPFSGG